MFVSRHRHKWWQGKIGIEGWTQNTNYVEYDGQLVDEDTAGPDQPPDSRCQPALSGGRPARSVLFMITVLFMNMNMNTLFQFLFTP